jgi:hypothetical protein
MYAPNILHKREKKIIQMFISPCQHTNHKQADHHIIDNLLTRSICVSKYIRSLGVFLEPTVQSYFVLKCCINILKI